ncbi:UNVERIFIED_CONTAM: hypothetical protein Sradi_7091500 [Sesamum radiatum]|uniref:Uncharacterized protein n=1 Tax=Sesamum radiatum TaxID=300843 RepID=A0AAW2J2N2_SESRA
MRSDLQDPFQKEFLQVKLSLLRKIQHFRLQLSAGELAPGELAACDLASSRPASWRARTKRARWLATLPARGLLELATCEMDTLVHPMDFLLLALKQSNCLRN